MCDTVACKQHDNSMFFGKNSDRHPSELQLVAIRSGFQDRDRSLYVQHVKSYEIQFTSLMQIIDTFEHPYLALLSRPAWLWGAEIGVNEHRVAIGNEAVFSNAPREPEGLLGMDILRLALHNAKTAKEACQFIVNLIERYGQGGNGAYKGSLYYDNSFLITDGNEIIVLETAGRRWAVRNVQDHASISNAYTIGDAYDDADAATLAEHRHFSHTHESRLHAWFSKGYSRHQTTMKLLSQGCNGWTDIRDVLLYNRKSTAALDRSMHSICLDALFPLPSRTTSSMIVHYSPNACIAWCNAAPLPCYHPYVPNVVHPVSFNAHLEQTTDRSYLEAMTTTVLTSSIRVVPGNDRQMIAHEARALEQNFDQTIAESFMKGDIAALEEDCTTCTAMAKSARVQLTKKLELD